MNFSSSRKQAFHDEHRIVFPEDPTDPVNHPPVNIYIFIHIPYTMIYINRCDV